MAAESSKSLVLWALPRFHRSSANSCRVLDAPPPPMHDTKDDHRVFEKTLAVEPARHEAVSGLSTKH